MNVEFPRFLFLHIAKTGGVSVETLIKKNVPATSISPAGPVDFIKASNWEQAARYSFFFSHDPLYISSALPKPLITFTFLRNPVDRIVSAYNHILRDTHHRLHQVIVENKLSIYDVLEHPDLWVDFTDTYARILGMDIDLGGAAHDPSAMFAAHWFAWKTRPDKFTIDRAINRLQHLHFIGFTETFSHDCHVLGELLSFTDLRIPFENVAPKGLKLALPEAVRTTELERMVRIKTASDFFIFENAKEIAKLNQSLSPARWNWRR